MVITVATMVFGLAVPSGAGGAREYPPTTLHPGFHCDGINGYPRAGEKVRLEIDGTGFFGRPEFRSTEPGTKVLVDHVDGKHLVIDVTIKAGEPKGWNTFTVILANGKSANQHFLVK